jgi:hypothetical protein
MAANNLPAFSAAANVSSSQTLNAGLVVGPTANTAMDGTGTLYPIFQAGTNAGSRIDQVVFKPVGSPAQTVGRLFWCSSTSFTVGSTNSASNTTYIGDVSLPAVTASQTLASVEPNWGKNLWVPPGQFLLVGFGTSTGSAGTGWAVTAFAGSY